MNLTTREGTMEQDAKNIIELFKADGFDNEQIKDAMCDGKVLKDYEISQEIAEEIYNSLAY